MAADGTHPDPDSLATHWSLVTRLKDWGDQEGWRQFFDLYGAFIHNVAVKAGLTEAEAQDAVQETLLTVARNLKEFRTDPAHGSFRAWLLKTTRWRILNQFKKRRPDQIARVHRAAGEERETATADQVADAGTPDLSSVWDTEWREHLLGLALGRLKHKAKPSHYQVFFLHAIKGQPVRQVSETLGVNVARVYLIKHRLSRQLREEVQRLQRELDSGMIVLRNRAGGARRHAAN